MINNPVIVFYIQWVLVQYKTQPVVNFRQFSLKLFRPFKKMLYANRKELFFVGATVSTDDVVAVFDSVQFAFALLLPPPKEYFKGPV